MSTNGDFKRPLIPSALVEKLERDDREAWEGFLGQAYRTARQVLIDALLAGGKGGPDEAHQLIKEFKLGANEAGANEAEVALRLAWSSFCGKSLARGGAIDLDEEADYVALLIRVAYNQLKRQGYGDTKVGKAAGIGSSGGPDGPSLIERVCAAGADHEEDVALADFERLLVVEAARFAAHLKRPDREVLYLSVFAGMRPAQIHKVVGLSITRCRDLPKLWRDHIRQRYPVTLAAYHVDVLADDEPGPTAEG